MGASFGKRTVLGSLVYRPGEPAPGGNVFADFIALYETFLVCAGIIDIEFDSSLLESDEISLPPNTDNEVYDFQRRACFVAKPGTILEASDNVFLAGVARISGVTLKSTNTVGPVITAADGDVTTLQDAAGFALGDDVATKPVMEAPTGVAALLVLDRATISRDVANGNLVLRAVDTGSFVILGRSGASVDENTVGGDAASGLTLVAQSPGVNIFKQQSAMLGTISYIPILPLSGLIPTRINETSVIAIPTGYQMRIADGLDIDGELIVDGDLIID